VEVPVDDLTPPAATKSTPKITVTPVTPVKQAPAPRRGREAPPASAPAVRWRPEPTAGSNGSNGSGIEPTPVNGTAKGEASSNGSAAAVNGTDAGIPEIAVEPLEPLKPRRRFLLFGRSR
jgi:hypothetical protein